MSGRRRLIDLPFPLFGPRANDPSRSTLSTAVPKKSSQSATYKLRACATSSMGWLCEDRHAVVVTSPERVRQPGHNPGTPQSAG